MKIRTIITAMLLCATPLFAEQRTSSNSASATLTINIFVRPSLNTPQPVTKQKDDQNVIFNLAPAPQLTATKEEVPISTTNTQPSNAVLRTTTYTAQ